MNGILQQPILLFFCISIVLCLLTFAGYQLALRTSANDDSHRHEHIAGLREGLFVLLGLLLGFTVAMVLPRFDQRGSLVVEEAHSIKTTWLQAQVLPEPQRAKTLQLLREYVAVRRQFSVTTLANPRALNAINERTTALQEQLWQQFLEAETQNQTATVAVYERSLSKMIGVSETRLTAFESRVPEEVWVIILVVAAFQSFVTGYSMKRKVWLSLMVTPVVIAVVIALIGDLDDPHSGLIRFHQNSLNRLANELVER